MGPFPSLPFPSLPFPSLPFPREGEGPLEAAFSCPILGKSKEALLLAAQGLGGIFGGLAKGGRYLLRAVLVLNFD